MLKTFFSRFRPRHLRLLSSCIRTKVAKRGPRNPTKDLPRKLPRTQQRRHTNSGMMIRHSLVLLTRSSTSRVSFSTYTRLKTMCAVYGRHIAMARTTCAPHLFSPMPHWPWSRKRRRGSTRNLWNSASSTCHTAAPIIIFCVFSSSVELPGPKTALSCSPTSN